MQFFPLEQHYQDAITAERVMKEKTGLAAIADRNHNDVYAQLEAAYEFDKAGDEHRALHYYEAALSLTIPESEQAKFSISFGSTLTNNGRFEDSIAHLHQASLNDPQNAAVFVFMSFALRRAGRLEEAYTTLLKAIVIEAGDTGLNGFNRAVSEYLDDLEKDNSNTRP